MKRLITVAGLVLLVGCQAPPVEMTEAEIAQIEAEVTAVAHQLMEGFKNLDLEEAAAVYDPSSMHGNDGATYYATYDEWVVHLEEMVARFDEMDGEWMNTRVDVIGPDAAVFVGQYDWTVTAVSGTRSRVEAFITQVMRAIGGEWKITHQASMGRWTTLDEG